MFSTVTIAWSPVDEREQAQLPSFSLISLHLFFDLSFLHLHRVLAKLFLLDFQVMLIWYNNNVIIYLCNPKKRSKFNESHNPWASLKQEVQKEKPEMYVHHS